jgi:FkbM family methyltransferase
MTAIPKHELLLYRKLSKDFKIVFDVGCRDDLDYYDIKSDCEYHLFEPHTPALDSIKVKIEKLDNPVIYLNEFGLSNETIDNHIYYENVQSFEVHWCVPSKDLGHRYSLKKLDDYVESNKVDKIDFLKIDVEGLDYQVLLGGLKTIKDDNKVSFIQIEYSHGLKKYVNLLDNFNFYLMIEPRLLKVINKFNESDIDFNKSLVKLTKEVINFIEIKLAGTGAGGNIFGINKNIDLDIIKTNNLIIKITK